MKTRKVPLRKCLGCHEQKDKKQLIRIVKNKENEIKIDFSGKSQGRGAYICPDIECLVKAQKKKALSKAFQYDVPKEIYENLIQELKNNE